jgi:outer membrane protein assembly factor BamD (BamD/ComL family)
MIQNPIIQDREFNKQFSVTFVLNDITHAYSIQKFCNDRNIGFLIREFNSSLYSEDCENILRLPAIHLYHNERHIGTYYPIEDPISSIQREIKSIQDEQERKKLKANTKWWKRLLAKLKHSS